MRCLLAFFLVLVVAAGLTGCGSGAPSATDSSQTGAKTSEPPAPPPPPANLKVAAAALKKQPAHAGPVRFAVATPDGKRLISGGEDGRVLLWDLPLAKPGAQIDGLAPPVALSLDGGQFAAWQAAGGKIGVFDVAAPGKPKHEIPAVNNQAPGFLAFTEDGLLAGDAGGAFRLLDLGGQQKHTWKGVPTPDWRAPASLAASRDGKHLARTYLGSVELRQAHDGVELRVDELKGSIPSVAFHPKGTALAIADGLRAGKKGKENDTEVVVRRVPEMTKLMELKKNSYRTLCLAFAPDGRLLAVAGDKLQIWDWDKEKLLHTSDAPHVCTLHWATASTLVGGTETGEVVQWDLKIEPAK
jgi:WD40 repeat protein